MRMLGTWSGVSKSHGRRILRVEYKIFIDLLRTFKSIELQTQSGSCKRPVTQRFQASLTI